MRSRPPRNALARGLWRRDSSQPTPARRSKAVAQAAKGRTTAKRPTAGGGSRGGSRGGAARSGKASASAAAPKAKTASGARRGGAAAAGAAKRSTSKASGAAASQAAIGLKQMAGWLAEDHDLPKRQVEALLGDLVATFAEQLKKGAKIRVNGLGIFQVRARPARMGRNPATGEQIQIKASKKIAFRPAKELKEAI
jgi:DNA-binding protein HU-beta